MAGIQICAFDEPVLDEPPEDAIVPARIVVAPDEAGRIASLIEVPPAPTEAMKRLFEVD